MSFMNNLTQRFAPRIVALALFAFFCVTLTYWIVTLGFRDTAPLPAAAPKQASTSIDAAETLFGSHASGSRIPDIQLSGILALAHGAAAIVSYGNGPARSVPLTGSIAQDVKLIEVRARSIIVERDGRHSEVFLQKNTDGQPTIYVR